MTTETTDLPAHVARTDIPTPSDEGTVRVRVIPRGGPPSWLTHTINPRCRCCGQLLPRDR